MILVAYLEINNIHLKKKIIKFIRWFHKFSVTKNLQYLNKLSLFIYSFVLLMKKKHSFSLKKFVEFMKLSDEFYISIEM